jgi:hypothetical protein
MSERRAPDAGTDAASGTPACAVVGALVLAAAERAVLLELLETLCERESKIGETLYPAFFARRPDARPLFGVHALAEREEMLRETFRSLLALAEGQPWLAGNLAALGKSHAEYGVTGDMYPDFVDVLVEVAASDLEPRRQAVLAEALSRITDAMRRAGDGG